MSDEDRYDYSESFGSFSEFSNESLKQLIISGEDQQLQQLNNRDIKNEAGYQNLFHQINEMENQEINFKSGHNWNDGSSKSEFNWVLDELVNKNLPDVFKNTSAFVRDEDSHQVWETMVLSGFYKNVVVNEVKRLMAISEFDNEAGSNLENITEEDEHIICDLVHLPDPKLLAELTESQRCLVSNTYKSLQDSNYTYNKLLKYSIPAQFADLEIDRKTTIGKKKEAADKNESKLEMFKPPRIIFVKGIEYYFNCTTGLCNQNLNYRCRDYKCKGSMKVPSIDPFLGVEVFKGHSPSWSEILNGDAFVIEKEDWETQIKYNFFVESTISQEKYTNAKCEDLYTNLKIKAAEISKQTNTLISAPDREAFVHMLRRERQSLNPKSYIDKVIFNSMFRKTLNEEKYLRLSQDVLDSQERRQKLVLWMSDYQQNVLSWSQNIKIGIITYQVPRWFKACVVIMAFWTQKNQFISWCFWLVTSLSSVELFKCLFRYLTNQLRIFPNEIVMPWNQSLMQALQKWYPKATLIGWFKDLIVKVLRKYIQLNPKICDNFEEINFSLFSNISKSFFRYSDINKTIELIENKIESFSQDHRQKKLIEYLKCTLIKYSQLLDYKNTEAVTLIQVEEFWGREVLWAGDDVGLCVANFIKCIIKIENELHYNSSVKSDFLDIWNQQEKEDTIDVTEINREYFWLYNWETSQTDEHWQENFDYDVEAREIAKLQKEYASQLLDWFHQNSKLVAIKKRHAKEAFKKQIEKAEAAADRKLNIQNIPNTGFLKEEIDLTVETKKKARKDIRKQIWEILTIDD